MAKAKPCELPLLRQESSMSLISSALSSSSLTPTPDTFCAQLSGVVGVDVSGIEEKKQRAPLLDAWHKKRKN